MWQEKNRLINKYRKIKKKGILFASIYIFFYTCRDIINNLIIKVFFYNKDIKIKNVLFIEPIKQGYGDLFFQTALFKGLKNNNYTVSILVKKNHSQILDNNPDIKMIYFWNRKDLIKIVRKKYLIIGLGRDTLRETFLMLSCFRSEKILLDKNIELWVNEFKDNSSTLAWQSIVDRYLNIKSNVNLPNIHFSEIEKNITTVMETGCGQCI